MNSSRRQEQTDEEEIRVACLQINWIKYSKLTMNNANGIVRAIKVERGMEIIEKDEREWKKVKLIYLISQRINNKT